MERTVFHGEVPDAAAFLNQHSVMAVPLLSGGGMRAKILEGMALGKAVLSTSLGMEGIDARDREECLLADSPEDWLQAVQWCYDHPEQLRSLGGKARLFCEQSFENQRLAAQLLENIVAAEK
jgi:glycosyltransferase involved in cell wall biosynthesis